MAPQSRSSMSGCRCCRRIVLTVRLVVFVVVSDEVGEGEAVMRRDEIDASPGFASLMIITIA